MKIIKLKERIVNCTAGLLAFALFYSPLIFSIWANNQFKELGEGYRVRDLFGSRMFHRERNRVYLDNNRDGILDQTCVNMPVSPFMGGPGWRLFQTKTTEEDLRNFQRANYLFNKSKAGTEK